MFTQQPAARLGDTSNHGGTIITAASNYRCDGIPAARVGDLHFCPRKGHGVTPIVTGSILVRHQGKYVACIGSITGCGAVINVGSPTTRVPYDAFAVPPNAFILDESSMDSTFILG
jgi:uncharacterized Zn-binding protein involved in type VI secretion